MPPTRKFTKEEIIKVAYDLAKHEGLDGINARRIASILGSSVQPIFHNFKNMEELKEAVYDKIYNLYQEYMQNGSEKEKPYKEMGLSYIKFAKDYPEFFKIIFMQKTSLNPESFILADDKSNKVIALGQQLTGLNFEEQKIFHVRVWIFTHGIACLVATNTIKISDSEIDKLLESTVKDMLTGYLNQKERGKNEKSN